jgi:hypothetical protein
VNGPGIAHTSRYRKLIAAGITNEIFWAGRDAEAEERLAQAEDLLIAIRPAVADGSLAAAVAAVTR